MKNYNLKLKISFYFFVAIFTFLFFVFLTGRVCLDEANAANLTYVKDLISTSAPNTASNHTIEFTVTNTIPASGKIVIQPEAGYFTVPWYFDYTDVDLSVATGGPFIDRQLATTSSATEDGVVVVSGPDGSLTITLNSSDSITAGSDVKIELGSIATFGETGDQFIVNPGVIASYKIYITTKNSSDTIIDRGIAMIAVVGQVTVSPDYPLELFNGLPSGEISAGNSSIEISLNTNRNATCRYATTSDVAYSSMTGVFTYSGGTLHTEVLSGLTDGASYLFYVKCADFRGYNNPDDYIISFSIKPANPPPGGGGGGGGSGGSSVGDITGGSPVLFLSSVILEGWSYPGSMVTFLKDGEVVRSIKAKSDGSFMETIDQLERGTYTFAVYATDSAQRKSVTYSSTITLGQGTQNRISQIVIPPTIELENSSVELGDDVIVFGESVAGGTVEVSVSRQSNQFLVGEASKFTASSSKGIPGIPDGIWEISFDTDLFTKGTYEVKARTFLFEQAESGFGRTLFLGVGEEPNPDFFLRADINKDGKVNLVDFSIMLVYWGTSDADADINSDGDVDVIDFSIMLFYWTG